jgi:DNA adenine methylase
MGSNHNYISPLRYPGGKSKVSSFIEDMLLLNNLEGCNLYELYAGGAGASLNILFSGLCNKLILNDLDYHIYAFWQSILNHTEDFIRLIRDTDVNIENWDLQKDIYEKYYNHEILEVGFSTFFLNRCNRSGILYKAGPIGGRSQTGNYKIDVRFNKNDLINRVEQIANFNDKIEICNLESLEMIDSIFKNEKEKTFLFLDPPYYIQGEHLYLSCYDDNDHEALSKKLLFNSKKNWFLTYDNCDRINELYSDLRRSELSMSYTLQNKRKAKEVMVFSDSLYLPKQVRIGSKSSTLSLINQ